MHRFFNDLLDQKAQQQIEFVQDPTNIDDALVEVVKYQESYQSGNVQKKGTGQCHARTACMNAVQSEASYTLDNSENEANSQVTQGTKPCHKHKKVSQMFLKKNSRMVKWDNRGSCSAN